jgi:hypothetical protein
MSTEPKGTKKLSKKHAAKPTKSASAADPSESQTRRSRETDDVRSDGDETAQKATDARPSRTGGQNRTIDQKRNDEQQYHAGGAAHDPHNRTQELVDSGDSDAGDIDEETRSASAPYNKTYGHHE